MHVSQFDGTFEGWVAAARANLQRRREPSSVEWVDAREGSNALWGLALEESEAAAESAPVFRVPKRFMETAREVSCHADPDRWPLLYRVLWRLTNGQPHLLEVTVDPDVRALVEKAKSVGREVHKMRAFVRFREVHTEDGPWFTAWFEPEHHIVEWNAGFFRDRFTSMRWSILTPEKCVHWDGVELRYSPGVTRAEAPVEDRAEDLWRTYYASIFNPARVKEKTMRSQMAPRYWKNLPEAAAIPTLLAEAPLRVQQMREEGMKKVPVTEFVPFEVPDTRDHAVLAAAANECRGCPLWKNATCAVFGEGPAGARVLVVGEQPGDQEDRAGKPFVGPAGQLLNRALAAAGVPREQLYVTNAVKHFKWTPRGKRRIHARPSAREIAACRPWLEAEIRAVKPTLIVCLGATAAQTVCGPGVRVTHLRGERVDTEFGIPAFITVHPSSLLRGADGSDPDVAFRQFVEDLKRIQG